MRVSVLELPASWGTPEIALATVEQALATGPETDLVLLPEASLTGYVSPAGVFDPTPFAEPIDGPTARRLAAIAKERRSFLAAPLILREGRAIANAMLVLDREGRRVVTYRKRHPWFPEDWATAGTEPHPVFQLDGFAVTIAICFDVHFLRGDAADALAAADLLLFASAWVESPDTRSVLAARPGDTREALLADLAREYDVTIANANWGPGVVSVAGQGGSCVVDHTGAVLARVSPGTIRADVSVGTSCRR